MPARPLKPIPSNPVFPRAASSVLIVSPWLRTPTIDDPADYKVLMLRRSSRGFFGSLRVFPGGVLEDADKDPVWRTFIFPKFSNVTTSRLEEMEDAVLHDYEYLFRRGDPENRRVEGDARRDYGLGLMIAAVRETFEECGIALLYPRIDWLQGKKGSSEERVRISEAWRRKVHDDASQFATLCETFGVAPDLEKVVFWSNWNTPETEIRTYDAHFFLSVLDHPVGVGAGGSSSAGGGEPEQPGDDEVHPYVAADGTETLEFAWVTPQEGLDKFGSGDWEMVEPQFCSLAELRLRYPTLSHMKPYTPSCPPTTQRRRRTRLETLKNCPEFYFDEPDPSNSPTSSSQGDGQVLVFPLDRLHTRTPSLVSSIHHYSESEPVNPQPQDKYRVLIDYDVEGTVNRMVFKGMEYVRTVEGFSRMGLLDDAGGGEGEGGARL